VLSRRLRLESPRPLTDVRLGKLAGVYCQSLPQARTKLLSLVLSDPCLFLPANAGGPICTLRATSRTPADRATAPDCYFIALAGLRHVRTGSASHPRLHRFLPRFLTRLQTSLNAAARRVCSPFSDSGFYVRAFTSRVTSTEGVEYNYAANSQFPRPDFSG